MSFTVRQVARLWHAINRSVDSTVNLNSSYLHPIYRSRQTASAGYCNQESNKEMSEISITLSLMDDLVALDVQDDGTGFAPEKVSAEANGGFGLRAMRERVEALDGSLLVESAPGEGCTLVVRLPLVAEEAAATVEAP
jgi:signal transduction histidine kinase